MSTAKFGVELPDRLSRRSRSLAVQLDPTKVTVEFGAQMIVGSTLPMASLERQS